MSNAAIGEAFISAVWYFGCFLIGVAICRWAFRINDIVSRLDKLIALATPPGERPSATPNPQEAVKVTLGEPYIPNANRLPRQD